MKRVLWMLPALVAIASFGCGGPGATTRVVPRFTDGGTFCPVAVQEPIGGRDFNGAVHMNVTVALRPSESGREVLANVVMLVEKNSTTVPRIRKTFEDIVVYTMPSDTPGRITRIEPSFGAADGITPGAGAEFGVCNDGDVFVGPGALVTSGAIERIEVIGDTGDGDISDDEDCGCDTKIKSLTLSEVQLTCL